MHAPDPDVHARKERVQELCRQLGRLLTLSLEQRKKIDRLLGELELVTRRAGGRVMTKVAGVGRGPSRADRK
jgi:hypothetical protein